MGHEIDSMPAPGHRGHGLAAANCTVRIWRMRPLSAWFRIQARIIVKTEE